MSAIILGGEKPRNELWANDVAKSMQRFFGATSVFRYKHWQAELPDAKIDIDGEVARLKERMAGEDQAYDVVAKSAGCWVTLRAIQEQAIKPARVILMGLPVYFEHEQIRSTQELLAGYQGPPTLFIQQRYDPAIGSEELRQLIEDTHLEGTRVIGIPGDDHHYDRIDTVTSVAGIWLNDCKRA